MICYLYQFHMSPIICWRNESDLMKGCVMSVNSYPLFLSLKWGGGGGVSGFGPNRVTVFIYLILKKGLGLRPWATHTCLRFTGRRTFFPRHHMTVSPPNYDQHYDQFDYSFRSVI